MQHLDTLEPPEETLADRIRCPLTMVPVLLSGLLVGFAGPTVLLIAMVGLTFLVLRGREPFDRVVGGMLLLAVAVLAWELATRAGFDAGRRKQQRVECSANLQALGQALIAYRNGRGVGKYPQLEGSDVLALVVTLDVVPAERILCPGTDDRHHRDAEGRAILELGRIGPQHCSYAGRRNSSRTRYPGLFSQRGLSGTVLASDDDEGPGRRFNHGERFNLLFADGHVEAVSTDDPRLARAPDGTLLTFGRGGLLDPLAN